MIKRNAIAQNSISRYVLTLLLTTILIGISTLSYAAPRAVPSIMIGNVDVSTGELVYDISLGNERPPRFLMTFRSRSNRVGWFGRGWSSEIERRLQFMPDGATAVVYQNSGDYDVYGTATPEQDKIGIDKIVSALQKKFGQLPRGTRSELEESPDAWFWTSVDLLPLISPIASMPVLSRNADSSKPLWGSKPDFTWESRRCTTQKLSVESLSPLKFKRTMCNGEAEIYDELGNLVESFSKKGEVKHLYQNGKLVAREVTRDGTVISRMTFKWRGPVIVEFTFDKDVYKFEYDDRYRMVRYTGPQDTFTKYEFDSKARITSAVVNNEYRHEDKYNDDGKVIWESFSSNGKVLDTRTYLYEASYWNPATRIAVTVKETGRGDRTFNEGIRLPTGPTFDAMLETVTKSLEPRNTLLDTLPSIDGYYESPGQLEDVLSRLKSVTRKYNQRVSAYIDTVKGFSFEALPGYQDLDYERQRRLRSLAALFTEGGKSLIEKDKESLKEAWDDYQQAEGRTKALAEGRERAAKERAAFWRDFAENTQRAAAAWQDQMNRVMLASRGTTPELEQKAARDRAAFDEQIRAMEDDPQSEYNQEKRAHERERTASAQRAQSERDADAAKRKLQRDATREAQSSASSSASLAALMEAEARKKREIQEANERREREERLRQENQRAKEEQERLARLEEQRKQAAAAAAAAAAKKQEMGPIVKEAVAICSQSEKGKGWSCYGPLDNQILFDEPSLESALSRQGCSGGTWAAGGPVLRGIKWEAYRCGHGLDGGRRGYRQTLWPRH